MMMKTTRDLLRGAPGTLARRDGMTLLEVMLAMAIFLVGSVGILSLFGAASAMHAHAVQRRTASMIAEELLAEVQASPFRDVYAGTHVVAHTTGDSTVDGSNLYVDAADTSTGRLAAGFEIGRRVFVGGEVREVVDTVINTGSPDELELNTGFASDPDEGTPVLQPLTWDFVLGADLDDGAADLAVEVEMTPGVDAPADEGYIVVDEEWVRYTAWNGADTFSLSDEDQDENGVLDARGWGETEATTHKAGTPVTVAREHPSYPGYYYAVQYYPPNATGADARVVISVGYGNDRRFRVHTFHTVYTPSRY